MQSKATTIQQYLSELPPDRRAALQTVRDVIRKNLDPNYEEGMQYGMIGYYVPHRIFPDGYHCDPRQPLPFAGLASQKNYMAVYLMSVYEEGQEGKWFRSAWEKTGLKLDMGKCCIRFKSVDDVALDVLGEAVKRMPVDRHIEIYQAARADSATRKSASKGAVKKTGAKKARKTAKARPGRAAAAARRTAKSPKTSRRASRS